MYSKLSIGSKNSHVKLLVLKNFKLNTPKHRNVQACHPPKPLCHRLCTYMIRLHALRAHIACHSHTHISGQVWLCFLMISLHFLQITDTHICRVHTHTLSCGFTLTSAGHIQWHRGYTRTFIHSTWDIYMYTVGIYWLLTLIGYVWLVSFTQSHGYITHGSVYDTHTYMYSDHRITWAYIYSQPWDVYIVPV